MNVIYIFILIIVAFVLLFTFVLFYALIFYNPKDKDGISLRRWPDDIRKRELNALGKQDDDDNIDC